jgi:probable HAF family extracellular repeat protein
MPISFPHPRSRRFAAPLAAVLLLAACDDDPARVEPPQSVTLRSEAPTGTYLDVGATLPLSVSATSVSGGELAGRTFTWASSNPAVATVADGVVTGVAPGTATISATNSGVTGQLQVIVEPRAANLAVWPTDVTLGVGARYPTFVNVRLVTPGDTTRHSVHYSTSAAGVVTVSSTGTLQAVGTGTATVTVRAGTLVREVPVTVEAGYVLVPLGTLGGMESEAAAVNEAGEVVGRAQGANGEWYPFHWKNGTMAALPTPVHPSTGALLSGEASDINDAGTVVGKAGGHAASWSNGVMTDLHPADEGAFSSVATGINSRGDVVGYLADFLRIGRAAFLLREGQTIWLPENTATLRHTVEAINDDGVVVGRREYLPFSSRPIVIRNGSVTDLGLGYDFGYSSGHGWATDVNAAGAIVGSLDAGPYGVRRPYLWLPSGAAIELGTLGGNGPDYGEGINDRGDVVGKTEAHGVWAGFRSRNGVLVDLNGLVAENGGWRVEWAMEINNRGQIAATARNLQTGKVGAVLLTPLEP